jgi:hypothetical protein
VGALHGWQYYFAGYGDFGRDQSGRDLGLCGGLNISQLRNQIMGGSSQFHKDNSPNLSDLYELEIHRNPDGSDDISRRQSTRSHNRSLNQKRNGDPSRCSASEPPVISNPAAREKLAKIKLASLSQSCQFGRYRFSVALWSLLKLHSVATISTGSGSRVYLGSPNRRQDRASDDIQSNK